MDTERPESANAKVYTPKASKGVLKMLYGCCMVVVGVETHGR